MMDATKAIEELEKMKKSATAAIDISSKMGAREALMFNLGRKALAEICIDALRARQDDWKNDPLTLDEMREMDGRPVWVVPGNSEPRWCIVRYYGYPYDYVVCRNDIDDEFDEEDYAVCGVINNDCEWLAYRRPPREGEK